MAIEIIHINDDSKKKILTNYIQTIVLEKPKNIFGYKDKFTGELHNGYTLHQWKNKIMIKIRNDFLLSNESVDLLEEVLKEFVDKGLLTITEKDTHIKLYG